MAQQKASGNYSNSYLFNGKELDEETGLYYYGARYYNPRYSVWLGVDPMVEKYAGVSPYNYTLNNPVIFIDPDGRDILIWYEKNGKLESYRFNGSTHNAPDNKFVSLVIEAWNYNVGNGGGDNLFNAAVDITVDLHIMETALSSISSSKNKCVYWNPNAGIIMPSGEILSPATILEHEVDHQYNFLKDPIGHLNRKYADEENRVRSGSEFKTAVANGELKKSSKWRMYPEVKSQHIITTGVTSNKEESKLSTQQFKSKIENAVIVEIQRNEEQ